MWRCSSPSGSSSSSAEGPPPLSRLIADLAHADADVVLRAVGWLGALLRDLGGTDYRKAVEALCGLFYVDVADRPDLEEALARATAILAREGKRVVPLLLAQMQTSDIKSHLYLARTLGAIGRAALPRLRDVLATSEDAYLRAFALYAIGKMTCPEVVGALPEAIGGLMHPDREVRDSAARALGKIAAVVPPRRLTPRRRREMFESLSRSVRDPEPPVRAKAMRSLGKMATAGLLNRTQKRALTALARAALGESEEFAWDQAYIVRREAGEVLQILASPC